MKQTVVAALGWAFGALLGVVVVAFCFDRSFVSLVNTANDRPKQVCKYGYVIVDNSPKCNAVQNRKAATDWCCPTPAKAAPKPVPMPRPIDENELAIEVSRREGLKVEVNIAQIKEVQRCLLEALAERDPVAVRLLIDKHGKHAKND